MSRSPIFNFQLSILNFQFPKHELVQNAAAIALRIVLSTLITIFQSIFFFVSSITFHALN